MSKPTLSAASRPVSVRLPPHCPKCGAVMSQCGKLFENGKIFVWYTCKKGGCDGQWLAHGPNRSEEIWTKRATHNYRN